MFRLLFLRVLGSATSGTDQPLGVARNPDTKKSCAEA